MILNVFSSLNDSMIDPYLPKILIGLAHQAAGEHEPSPTH